MNKVLNDNQFYKKFLRGWGGGYNPNLFIFLFSGQGQAIPYFLFLYGTGRICRLKWTANN